MSPRSLDQQVEWVAEHSGAHPAVVALMADDHGRGGRGRVRFAVHPVPPSGRLQHPTVEDSVYVAEGSAAARPSGEPSSKNCSAWPKAHGFHAVIGRIAGWATKVRWRCTQARGFEMIGTERKVDGKFGRWLDVVCMERLIERCPVNP